MTEWKEYKLGEIADILDYKRKPLSSMERSSRKGIYPYYGASGVIDNIDDYIFDGEHVLISEDGENLRTRQTPIAFLANGKFWVNNHAHILKADYVHSRLICYYFAQLDLNPYITGAVQPKLSQDSLNRIPLFLPTSINEREKIVSILSSLDDKIDLLHRENATLEQMAETLFRQWFVVEAKEEWEEGKLTDYIKLIGGGTPKTTEESYWNGNVCWLSGGDIANNHKGFVSDSEKHISEIGLNNSAAKLLPENALVVSARGTVGKYCLLSKPMAFSQSNYGILPMFEDCYFFTYLLVAYHIDELQSAAYGSVFDTITTKTFEGVSVLLPKETGYIVEFEKMIELYFSKMKYNNNQIQTLIQTRDGLLPRLMNKEISIVI